MCTDTQVSTLEYKSYEAKLFRIPHAYMTREVVLAYSGLQDRMNKIVEDLGGRLVGESKSAQQIESDFQSTLDSVFRRKPKDAHETLCGFADQGNLYLLKSHNKDIFPVPTWACIGFGDSALTRYLAAIFLGNRVHLPIYLAVPICDYIIAQVKKYVQWCGGDTNLMVVTADGKVHEQIPNAQIDVLCNRIEDRLNLMLTSASMFDISEEQCLRMIRELRELLYESVKTFGQFFPELKKSKGTA